jgi:hypothetical protein
MLAKVNFKDISITHQKIPRLKAEENSGRHGAVIRLKAECHQKVAI